MKIISSIRIKYFRSILNTTRGNITHLPTKDLNIIVGSNDAGKSNYLRALNLFFNNECDPIRDFDFWKDFSRQRHGVRREENRIEIELIINPPSKQHFKNNGAVKWLKVWRESSRLPEEHIEYITGEKFTSNYKSSYYKWLKKIRFRYIPAIKSQEYFTNLMYDLYDILQKDTNDLERQFNEQVQDKTSQISEQLSQKLNLDSVLQFQGSFKELFNTLEFGSTDGKAMLNQRGDGIKVRHIPIILQNIADAELREERKREPSANTIWGFEEPENNLEFFSAKKLADNFLEYTEKVHFQNKNHSKHDEGIQIFITTHSPIFYTLSNESSKKIQTFFVSKLSDESSNIKQINNEDSIFLEDEMKLLPLLRLSKHWKIINKEMEELSKVNEELEKQKDTFSGTHKCIVLTEDEKKGLVEKFILANGFKLEEVDLRSYNGCSNIGSAEVLYKYLKDKYKEECPKIVIHRDKDYLTSVTVEEEIKKYKKKGLDLFITKGTDIESYFVRLNHLSKCHPDISKEDLKEILEIAKNEKKDIAIQAIRRMEYGDKHQNKQTHLSDAIPKYYEENIDALFHGKEVYKKVKFLIQEKTKNNANIDVQTDELIDEKLKTIASEIWN